MEHTQKLKPRQAPVKLTVFDNQELETIRRLQSCTLVKAQPRDTPYHCAHERIATTFLLICLLRTLRKECVPCITISDSQNWFPEKPFIRSGMGQGWPTSCLSKHRLPTLALQICRVPPKERTLPPPQCSSVAHWRETLSQTFPYRA